MLIIVDKKIPAEAKEKLSAYGTLLELETEGIVYPAISGHPDIFFCKTPQTLIVSPSLPEKYIHKLQEQKVQLILGNQASSIQIPLPLPPPQQGSGISSIIQHQISPPPAPSPKREGDFIRHPVSSIQYPASVSYNAAVSDKHLVHRLEYTDPVILQNCHTLKKIPVKQAYTRCNLLLLKEDHYITSDPGIHKNLHRSGLDGIFVSPAGIILPGFPNGFIGGAMGLLNDVVFVTGSLAHFAEGDTVRNFLEDLDYRIVELYDGPLFDGGGILFI